MADSHSGGNNGTFSPIVTGIFIAGVVVLGLLAVSTNPRSNLRQYQPQPVPVVAATTLPSPLTYEGRQWVPVEDATRDAAGVIVSRKTAGGLPVYTRSGEKDRIYVRAKDNTLQPYIPLAAYLELEPGTAAPTGDLALPPAFRFHGYTWHQNSNTISRDDPTEPMMKIGTVLGHAILASEPGPEAHLNSVYVEVRPGSKTLQPYIGVEALYSTSNEDGKGAPGISGKPNPYPTVDGPNLPYGSGEEPRPGEAPAGSGP